MSRELLVQLVARKKAINAKVCEAKAKYSQLYQEHSWVMNEDVSNDFPALTPEELKRQQELFALKDAILLLEMALNRAHFFGPRYTNGLVPSICINCFIDHSQESKMVEVESDRGNGIRQFECPSCKHVLRVNPL